MSDVVLVSFITGSFTLAASLGATWIGQWRQQQREREQDNRTRLAERREKVHNAYKAMLLAATRCKQLVAAQEIFLLHEERGLLREVSYDDVQQAWGELDTVLVELELESDAREVVEAATTVRQTFNRVDAYWRVNMQDHWFEEGRELDAAYDKLRTLMQAHLARLEG